MTDARLPDPWLGDPRFSNLSDGGWRLFTHALMWCNRYERDGHVPKQFYSHLLVEGDTVGQILELIDNKLAISTPEGFMIPWEDHGQSLAAAVQKTRAQNRERKRRQIEREDAREKARESTREVGQDRLGQDDTF